MPSPMLRHAWTGVRAAIAVLSMAVFGAAAQQPAQPTRPPARAARGAESLEARARRIQTTAIVLDTHIDTTHHLLRSGWRFTERHEAGDSHVDLPRMREGGLKAAFFAIDANDSLKGAPAVEDTLRQLDGLRRLAEELPRDVALCLTAADVRRAHRAGKVGMLIGIEGGHMIADSLPVLRNFARLGVRYLTLTHFVNTSWADSSGDKPEHNGLTEFGKEVVRELNRLGVLVDISHAADKTFYDALEVSRAPLIASHSSSRVLSSHVRNMADDMMKALAAKGGVVQINYHLPYLDEDANQAWQKLQPEVDAFNKELQAKYSGPENERKRSNELNAFRAARTPMVSWTRIVDHIEHAVRLVGADHVGLGSDFDGATMPEGMEDCSKLPRITEELLRRGYSERDVRKILGENLLRVMEQVEAASLRPLR